MSISDSMFIEIIRGVSSFDPEDRIEEADRCVDLLRSYSPVQARALAAVLSSLAVAEPDANALESQLNALLELGQTGVIRTEDVEAIKNIDRSNLNHALADYVEDLLEEG